MPDAFYTQISNRGSIRISGADATSFLQGLITNDIEKASDTALLYACLLTPQGKFLHDFFIRKDGDAYLLDCEGDARAQDLYDRLIRYRLRAKVEITLTPEATVFAIIGNAAQGLPDPRHADMGKPHLHST